MSGQDGPQQWAEEVIWSLPNGLQGAVLFGADGLATTYRWKSGSRASSS
jgi:hypothetical protein